MELKRSYEEGRPMYRVDTCVKSKKERERERKGPKDIVMFGEIVAAP